MTMPFLACRDLSKRFEGTRAVDHADLTVEQGQIHALLGPSGCGKTTLLRLIGGLEVPDTGVIELDGRTLDSPSSFLRRRSARSPWSSRTSPSFRT